MHYEVSFSCALAGAAALPLQYLKSHDALAGGVVTLLWKQILIVLDAIVVYMALALLSLEG